MRFSQYKIKKICKQRGFALTELLEQAEISRTAYYSLIRKDSVIPKSILSLAKYLGVPVSDLLHDEDLELVKYNNLLKKVKEILNENKINESDNVRHTLLSLEKKPIERLNSALRYT